ncbi:MAG: hypothetical protein NXH97_14695 [Rhodobacteraceae bacterium]|nr:hypothetical protein [Paracoccaceae bacterium]
MTLNQRPLWAAVAAFVGDACTQHHPSVGDGREAFIDCFQRMAVAYSGKVMHLKRAIAEGKVVEHWDVLWVFPGTISNDNGLF